MVRLRASEDALRAEVAELDADALRSEAEVEALVAEEALPMEAQRATS